MNDFLTWMICEGYYFCFHCFLLASLILLFLLFGVILSHISTFGIITNYHTMWVVGRSRESRSERDGCVAGRRRQVSVPLFARRPDPREWTYRCQSSALIRKVMWELITL